VTGRGSCRSLNSDRAPWRFACTDPKSLRPSHRSRNVFGYPNLMTKRIAYLTWGSSSEITSFHDFTGHRDDLIYVRALPDHGLGECAAVVVPDGMDPAEIRMCGPQLNEYVRGGGFLVVFAASVEPHWLDVVDVRWRLPAASLIRPDVRVTLLTMRTMCSTRSQRYLTDDESGAMRERPDAWRPAARLAATVS
jgi:hypothetical protein